ncbi:MAG TPA: carboxypeptidase regulatory-like domain-containing protein, partial [Gemmatimonadales bacterium]
MRRSLVPFALAGLAQAVPLAGQTVEVRVTEEVTGTPAAGAIVRLLRDTTVVVQGLADGVGRIVVRSPGPGWYRLKADRIGYAGMVSEPFPLAAGETLRRDLMMPARRVELPTIEVRGENRCGSSAGDALAGTLWSEIQKALTANVLTQRAQQVAMQVEEFEREVSLNGRTSREWVVRSTVARGAPFTTVPAATLAEQGFVTTTGDTTVFNAPDAALLLSGAFVETHCFRAVSRQKDSLVGLAFLPVPGRQVPDVRGTLWVHRTSSELRFLEYRYVFPTGDREPDQLGGRVEFTRLPGGAWIVTSWHIRMPRTRPVPVRTASGARRQGTLQVGYLDRGGRSRVLPEGPTAAAIATVDGVAWDSLHGAGLRGAVVRIAGALDSAITDSLGRFRLRAHEGGRRTVLAAHPLLRLASDSGRREVELSIGDSVTVRFASPSAGTLAAARCGRRTPAVAGVARDSTGEWMPVPVVRAVWRAATGQVTSTEAVVQGGVFALCDLPADRSVPIRLYHGLRVLAESRVRVEPGARAWVELRAAPAAAGLGGTSGGPTVLAGVVREDSTGRPIQGVEVLVEGTTARGVTNEAGRYLVTGAAPGRVTLRFRLIGYRPARQPVALVAGDTTWASERLIPSAVVLPDVEVTAEAPPAPRGVGIESFEERRRLGFGAFIDSTALARRESLRLGDVLAQVNGITVQRQGTQAIALSNRQVGNSGERCPMAIWLDGVRIFAPDAPAMASALGGASPASGPPDLNFLLVHQMAAIEV